MATVTHSADPAPRHASIRSTLQELRRRIGRYVISEGLARVVAVAGLFFWATLAIDSAWFGFRRLELPGWFRLSLMAIGVAMVLYVLARHVVMRMLRSYPPRELALVLERRFPELNDSLITAVEMSGPDQRSDGMTQAMLVRTEETAGSVVRKLPIGAVFAIQPLRAAVIGALVAVISVGGLGVASGATVTRWWRAFALQQDRYWERENQLRVLAVVQPGDRLRSFREYDDRLELLHPRNTDLTILIQSDDSEAIEWAVPERVRLDLRRSGDEKRVYLTQLDEGRFRYSIDRLNDNLEFDIQGGDFANRLPFRVRVVDPPRIDGVTLQCDYPDYTNWNESHPREIDVTGTQAELPLETRFDLVATTNKSLQGFHLEVGNTELTLNSSEAVVKVSPDDEGAQQQTALLPPEIAGKLLSDDRRSLNLPLVVTSAASNLADDDRIAIPPDSILRFYLHDDDDIVSAEPIVLRVMGVPDEPPTVECERQGVGDAITRKASVPISGVVADDYGIDNARFEFKVDDEEKWRPRRFRNRVSGRPQDFVLQGQPNENAERFNVTVLGLDEGQKLTLSVFAVDADDIHGPNAGRSQRFEFRIVSNEELLSLLYSREINLRRRFEEVIRQVEEVRDDLAKHRTRITSPDGGSAEVASSVTACASRTLNTIRKNANESRSIELAFDEIVEELINNAIPPQSLAEEMRKAIVQPLRVINDDDFPGVDAALGSFKLAAERNSADASNISESIAAVDAMLANMRVLLDEIKDLAELHEIVNDLKQLIDAQQDVLDKTKGLQKQKLIEKLKLLGGDDDQ